MEAINKSPHKKKFRLGLTVGDAGGIGGVVLLGGSLAIAGLLAAFTIIKSKNGRQDGKNEDPTTPSNQKQDESHGLSFVLQSPPTVVQHQNSCRTVHELSKVAITVNRMASCELVSTHTLGDKPVMITDGKEENPSSYHLEILNSDDSKKERAASSREIPSPDVALLPMSNIPPLDTPENLIKNVFSDNLLLVETTEAQQEDEPTVAEKLAVQENSAMQSFDVEEGENGDDSATGHVIEKEENGDDFIEKEEENYDDITKENVMEKHVTGKDEESSEGIWAVKENSPGQSVEKAADEDVTKENESMEAENLAPEENLPVLSGVKNEGEDNTSEENVSEKEEESSEGAPSVENSSMQSTEEEEEEEEDEEDNDKEDDNNNNFDFNIEEYDSITEHVTEKDEESSEGIWAVKENSLGQSVEKAADEDVKKENESMEAENLAPEENLPVLSGVKEEDEDDISEENVSENEEESSEGEPSVKKNSPMQSTEEKEDEDEDEDDDKEEDDNNNYDFNIEEYVMEKVEGSSDGIGCSSIESTAEAVWPGEMIKAFSHELKKMNVSNEDSGEQIVKPVNHDSLDFNSGGNSFSENDNSDGNTENSKTIMANAQTVHLPSRRRRIWFWSLIMVALLMLLLLIHHTAMLDDLTYPDPVIVP